MLRIALALFLVAAVGASTPTAIHGLPIPPTHAQPRPLSPLRVFPNISHTGSEMNFALAFAGPPLLLRGARSGATACKMASQTLERENPLIHNIKKGWIEFERMMVTITSGSDMAKAAVTLEDERLFGSHHLARAKRAVDNMISNTLQQKTANLDDCYSAQAFGFEASQHLDQPHKVRPRREHAPPVSFMAHKVPTADMSDFYSKGVFSGAGDEMELSAGYREGDDDDLPLLKDLKKAHPTGKDARYAGEKLHKDYPDSAFRD